MSDQGSPEACKACAETYGGCFTHFPRDPGVTRTLDATRQHGQRLVTDRCQLCEKPADEQTFLGPVCLACQDAPEEDSILREIARLARKMVAQFDQGNVYRVRFTWDDDAIGGLCHALDALDRAADSVSEASKSQEKT